jgi:hypothetical protein
VVLPTVAGSQSRPEQALCAVCIEAGQAGDADTMKRRAADNEDHQPDDVDRIVRAVLRGWGHELAPGPDVPEQFRHRRVAALTPDEQAIWDELRPLIFRDSSADVISGRIEATTDGSPSSSVIHRDGRRVRISGPDGAPLVVTDGETMCRRETADQPMTVSPYRGEAWGPHGSELAYRRSTEDIELFSFGTPVPPFERVSFLDRPAWRFRFAAPRHKPYDMWVVVDGETGLVLEQRFADHAIAGWTEFVVGGELDASLFVWDGPTTDLDAVRAAEGRTLAARERRAADWLVAHVPAQPITVDGRVLEIQLHDWADDGSFEASVEGPVSGVLARRPRSDRWWRLDWSDVTHRWSDQRWDWALTVWADDPLEPIDEGNVSALKAALGEPR